MKYQLSCTGKRDIFTCENNMLSSNVRNIINNLPVASRSIILPKLKAEANNWFAYLLGKRSNLPFFMQEQWQEGESVVLFTYEQNIICSQTQLNNIAHEQTIISRQLFVDHVVGVWPMKSKKILHKTIITVAMPTW